jgi:hypothetical protein
MDEEDLGDGLFVSHDGWQFALHVPRHGNAIVLDEKQLKNLLRYITKVKQWQDDDATRAEKAEARKRDSSEGFPE